MKQSSCVLVWYLTVPNEDGEVRNDLVEF
jgi:hypothetical protein